LHTHGPLKEQDVFYNTATKSGLGAVETQNLGLEIKRQQEGCKI